MANEFYVIARPSIGDRVALAERHPDHPLNEYGEHEVYIAKGVGPVLVAETPEVMRQLAPTGGTLMRIDGDVLTEAQSLHDKELESRRQRREALLLEQRQAKAAEIGDARDRLQELQLQIAKLERQLAGTLRVAEAQTAADRAAEQHDAALDAAEAHKAAVDATVSASEHDADKPVTARAPARRGVAVTTLAPADSDDENKPNDMGAALDAAERR
jgi:hypothetical protein